MATKKEADQLEVESKPISVNVDTYDEILIKLISAVRRKPASRLMREGELSKAHLDLFRRNLAKLLAAVEAAPQDDIVDDEDEQHDDAE